MRHPAPSRTEGRGASRTVGLVTKAELHDLVEELPDEALDGAALFLRRLVAGQVDPDQAWVRTEEWQGQLQSSRGDLAAGRTQLFGSAEDFFASL